MSLSTAQQFDAALQDLLAGGAPRQRLGVAVSGGSDSTALLHLLADWARRHKSTVFAISIDHGLRASAADELRQVARHCAALGVQHQVLTWSGWDGQGNLQDAARRARYRLIGDWAQAAGIPDVLLGHTQDDQAETVLMRLARGSGVDGLSGMAPVRRTGGVRWLRPMLGMRREALRGYLRDGGISWAEDPSNQDARFDRVKMRRALELLAPLGIDAPGLAQTAARLGSVREVLQRATHDAARALARVQGGAVYLQSGALMQLAPETRRRLLAHALNWVSGAGYAPRHASLLALERGIGERATLTLHGCLISTSADFCVIAREFAAVAGLQGAPGAVWDRRWRLSGGPVAGATIRATGDKGLKSCDNWRDAGLERPVLLAAPAVWLGDELLAAPLAGLANGWRAELVHDENHFYTTILSH